jgi:hypothetical protein
MQLLYCLNKIEDNFIIIKPSVTAVQAVVCDWIFTIHPRIQ